MATIQLKPKYYFGVDSIKNLNHELKSANYKCPMILYGGGSIKNNGLYNEIKKEIKKSKLKSFEFSNIEPNPRDTTIFKAARYAEKNKVDLIIAAGGGSVIDASKVIATLATNPKIKNTWQYVENKSIAKNKPIDVFSIITLAGTGSENNSGSVVTNIDKNLKVPCFNVDAIPKVAFEDATYLLTLSEWQMNSGIFDCLSHLLEQWYAKDSFLWTQEFIIANLQTLIKSTNEFLKNKKSIKSLENILWTTSMSLNGLASFNSDADWNVHALEHSLSAYYDVTHGAGLALITPTYIKLRSLQEPWFKQKTIELAKRLFDLKTVDSFCDQLINIIKKLKLPTKYKDFKEIKNISEKEIKLLAKHSKENIGSLSEKFYLDVFKTIQK